MPTKEQRNKSTLHNNRKRNRKYKKGYIQPNNSSNNITATTVRPINFAAAHLLGLRVRIPRGAWLSLL